MNAGRIEQVGTPQSIYANSASKFVQDFVGSTVTLQGKIISEGTRLFVELPQGERLQLPQDHLPAAADVYVTIRPEDIVPEVSRRDCAANELKAYVEDVLFLGSRQECILQAAGTEIVIETAELGAQPGEHIILKINPQRVRVWTLAGGPLKTSAGASEV
jgi:ABC-type Fe3+/spermidine/putrescine transport system ATPase subunit